MKWGESLCSGQMIKKECTACVSQQRGFPRHLSYMLKLRTKDNFKIWTINIKNKLGTMLSMGKITLCPNEKYERTF